MRRPIAVPLIVAVVLLSGAALTGCTKNSATTATGSPAPVDSATSSSPPATVSTGRLPGCESVTAAVDAVAAPILGGLSYNKAVSATNTAQESYEQRVCVYTTANTSTELGITIAAIPFQQSELNAYATLPNALVDPRLAAHTAVLQTFTTGDAADGHLDSRLYLIDTVYSITIQGITRGGQTTKTLPALSVEAATDAAFAVRDLIG